MTTLKRLHMAAAVVLCFGCYAGAESLTAEEQLGKLLFFDARLSEPGGQSCATCHNPTTAFADPLGDPVTGRPTSAGVVHGRFGSRNAQSISYAAFSPQLHFDPTMRPGIMEGMYVGGLFWDGRADTLPDQAKEPFLNPLEMNNPDNAAVVADVVTSAYAGLFEEVYGPNSLDDTQAAYDRVADAISAYERSAEVNPFTSKFDYYRAGQVALTEAEARGYALFTSTARCMNCHTATPETPEGHILFTNFGHQNTGVPRNPENPFYEQDTAFNPDGNDFVDLGLGAILGDPNQNGKFKIPSLRNVVRTAPYMHNGYFKTLRDIVRFNNTRDVDPSWPPPEVAENVHRHHPPMMGTFGRLGLSDQEIDDIVAFMETLTDGYNAFEAGGIVGDVNHDGVVNMLDVGVLASHWLEQ